MAVECIYKGSKRGGISRISDKQSHQMQAGVDQPDPQSGDAGREDCFHYPAE